MATATVGSSDDLLTTFEPPYKRVYQACEACRRKKQKCTLDAISPKPPCASCRRASIPCDIPDKRRRGRPAKKSRTDGLPLQDVSVMTSTMTTIPSAWEPHMGSSTTVDAQDYVERTALTPGSSTSTRPQPAPKLTSQAIANFPLRNTSDAARLLDRADPTESSQQETQSLRNPSSATSWLPSAETAADEAPTFFLTIEGLIDEASVTRLFQLYLTSIHPIMPLIPSRRMPATPIQIMSMAGREPFLMSAILVVTSGQSGEQALHSRIWGRTQIFFGEVALLGANVTIDSIEGLLLLSEYPPIVNHHPGAGQEDRICWMTVGNAVRLGYLLGLEQLRMSAQDADELPIASKDRAFVVWTYCHCLDRQISIRAGKSFWHRSPGLTHQHMHSDPAEDFAEMAAIPGIQDDYAGYIQCQVHLTQLFSNAHDLLYPSKTISIALATSEQYYKHIEDFSHALSAFRDRWQNKVWKSYPINECVWISFHHLRLYIYAFSFHAYIQRVRLQAEDRVIDLFPTGIIGSSDARFIFEAIDAVADVLRLAIGRLQPPGALSYLPMRFFLFFSHAGVFLLQIAVVVPLPALQKRAMLKLIGAYVRCMSKASTNPDHPGKRHSLALHNLLSRVCGDQNLQVPGSTRPSSPLRSAPFAPVAADEELSSILGSRHDPFVPERPLQDFARDIDALAGLTTPLFPTDLDPTQTLINSLGSFAPPSEQLTSLPFAPLFPGHDNEFWDFLTSGLNGGSS